MALSAKTRPHFTTIADFVSSDEYLDCFQSEAYKFFVMDELEHHYEEMSNTGERLKLVDVIGSSGVYFDEPDDEEDLSE
jgi:hypothetical protein